MKKKLNLLILFLILLISPIIADVKFYTNTKLFVLEREKESSISSFVLLPNEVGFKNIEDFLCSIFNSPKITLKWESQETEWGIKYRKKVPIYPRLMQTFSLNGKSYLMSISPVGELKDLIKGSYKIQIFPIESVHERKDKTINPLQVVSEEKILDVETKGSNLIFICFSEGKIVNVLMIFTTVALGGIVG